MGTRDFPDMYALSPPALGMHIRQITRAHVTTVTHIIYLSKPHSYMESDALVHALRTTMKNRIATHHCMVVHVQTNMINLRMLPYKCILMQKYSASFTDIPY